MNPRAGLAGRMQGALKEPKGATINDQDCCNPVHACLAERVGAGGGSHTD